LLIALHPDWSVAEVMSALMSTADTTVLKEDGSTPAGYFDMGSGRDDLSNAGETGFVLDESGANMEAADPATGGDPRTLNLASMADSNCLKTCSWTRNVTSVVASPVSWQVNTSSADGVVITVTPDSFVLPAGGSQELTITADVNGLPTDGWLFGEVTFSENSGQSINQVPEVHFPLAVVPTTGIFPDMVEITTRRNAGSQLEADLQAVEITDLTIESFGLVEATLTSKLLSQDPTNNDPYDNLNDGTTFFVTTTVPADAKRLVAETIYSEAPDVDLFVGTGSTPSENSLVCSSATPSALEYCELTDPPAGTYWILVQNWTESGDPPDLVTLASAVVPGVDSGNLTVDGPTSVPALTPFDIRVYWDTPEMKAGDRWYGAFSLGSDAGHAGDIATIPVNVVREDDDVTKSANVDAVMPGDVVTYTITVQPNVFSEELNYTITDTIPAGMTYVPDSASASDGTVNVVGDTVSWDVTMVMPEYGYEMSTSANDPLCDTGFGGYVNLEDYNIYPQASISGDTSAWTAFTSGNPFNYYGQQYTGMGFTDDGFAVFDVVTNWVPSPEPWTPQEIPDPTLPNNVLAMLWQDMQIFYDAATNSGVSLATLGAPGGIAIVEYDNIQFYGGSADNWDFEIVAQRAVDDTPGYYEYVFAYDNLNGDLTGPLTIGLENALGSEAVALVNDGDASAVLSNGFMVCFDYTAFGVSPATLTYQVTVDQGAERGDVFTNVAEHNTDNLGSLPAFATYTVIYPPYIYLPFIGK
jgi:uncharacterized repeat protein (TIGR01451 family)